MFQDLNLHLNLLLMPAWTLPLSNPVTLQVLKTKSLNAVPRIYDVLYGLRLSLPRSTTLFCLCITQTSLQEANHINSLLLPFQENFAISFGLSLKPKFLILPKRNFFSHFFLPSVHERLFFVPLFMLFYRENLFRLFSVFCLTFYSWSFKNIFID